MTAPTPPDYSTWKYRATIRITNPTATAAYQHRLVLAWRPGMRRDFRDIRFAQQNGINCPYWIESSTVGSTATIWIKVPSVSQRLIYLYYGNGQVASASSGANTFILFDNFEDGDVTDWTVQAGTGAITADSSVKYAGSYSGKYTHDASAADEGVHKAIALSTCVLEYRFRPAQTNLATYPPCLWEGNFLSNKGQYITFHSEGVLKTYDTDFRTYGFTYAAQWYKIKIVTKSTSQYDIYIDGALIGSNVAVRGSPSSFTRVYFGGYGASAIGNIDDLFIRLYTATEPTLAVTATGVNPWRVGRFCGITLTAGTEYVFDPVNVNHGMTAGVGGIEFDLATGAATHGMTPAAGGVEYDLATYNIYHPMYPTASWAQIIEPVVDTGFLIDVTVSQSMDDAMCEAIFEYDGDSIGGYFSGDYMTQVHVNIPDYLGVSNCVFVGLCPSSKGVYDVAKKKMTMRAVDYGIFLSKQTFDIKDLSLLPPANQDAEGTNIAKVLSCDNITKAPQIGMTITGSGSGATGTIFSVVQSLNGRILTLYPATGLFVDDEPLTVGGVVIAYADGRSNDIPYTPYYEEVMPEDWVKSILGGDNWMRVTGIEPTVLEDSGGYWDTEDCPSVPFMFGSLEKKRDGLMRVAKYMSYMWHVKPRQLGTGSYRAGGYFIKETSIDTLLALPAAATITSLDDFTTPITLDQDGEMQVDVVKVRCQGPYGNCMEMIRSNGYYDAGEGPYREFSDEPKDIATATDLAAYATDMYNLYSARSISWSGTLLARSDLQLYQLLNISGCNSGGVPDGIYRIIKISHEYGCAKNLTHITFMLSSAFSILRRYGMTYKDSISKVEQIVAGLENRKMPVELAKVVATDGWTIRYETEAGNQGMGRDSTSTPDTPGNIPVGAKISVQTMRGGVVCIPIVGASGTSTDLLAVDVPVIVSCAVDPDDANYWSLEWTPGANNQNVSVNFQTTGYPSDHGVVLPYGNDASCGTRLIPKSYNRTRIRFSGPNTTYYIRLWGERNGVYSATNAQTTITSGATVTPIDTPQEMQELGIVDQLLCSGTDSDWTDSIQGALVLFNGNLPFSYDGTSNIYIGGPVTDSLSLVERYGSDGPPPSGNAWYYHLANQPAPRYFYVDDTLTIVTPLSTITLGNGWHAPQKILLNPGTNAVTITVTDTCKYYRICSDLYIRTYYL